MSYEVHTVSRWKTIINIFKFLDNPIPLIDDTIKAVGHPSYRVHLGGINRSLMTQDPQVIQHVLQKNHKNYHKSKIQTEGLAKYAGYGLITTDGDYWLRQRRLIQPGFHKKKLQSIVALMNDEIINHIAQLKSAVGTAGITLDITREMVNLTLKVVSRSLFSVSITEDQLDKIGYAVRTSQVAVIKDIRQPMMKWWRKLTGEQKVYDESVRVGRELLMEIIETRKASTDRHDDLLDMLLSSRYEDTGEHMNSTQILDEILIIFAAGHETTANALTWTLYLLDQHPNILDRLQEEIKNTEISAIPGYEDISRLSYGKQVISESMRVFPPAWITDRIALQDDEVNGIKIYKGEIIGIYIYGAHHSEDLWDNPSVVDPERFTPENQKDIPAFAYFPFGGGPRLCIGQQFAWTEMQLALYHLIKHFDFKLIDGRQVELEPLITLRPKDGMDMNIRSRDSHQSQTQLMYKSYK